MSTVRRSSVLVALLGAAALLLAGCASATPATSGGTSVPGSAPSGVSELEVEAGWLDGGRQIALVTWGSSGCVPTASEATVQADGTLAVTLDDGDPATACTADYAPRVTLVGVPENVDPTKDLDLVITGGGSRGETDLDGAPGLAAGGSTDYAPSAGWVDGDMIAVLTWGSSSCAPQVESVAASDRANVTVTFATPPANQACTMDMAPRAVLVSVDGLDVDDDVATLTLSGGDAQFATPVTVSIIPS